MDNNLVTLNDFLYVEYKDSNIYARCCKIYTDVGICLYDEMNNKVCFIEGTNISCKKIEDKHYYITWEDSSNNKEYLYLILKDMTKNKKDFNVGDKVVIGTKSVCSIECNIPDTTFLYLAYIKDRESFEMYENELKIDFEWTIKEFIDDSIVVLQQDNILVHSLIKNLSTFDEIVKLAKEFKNKRKV